MMQIVINNSVGGGTGLPGSGIPPTPPFSNTYSLDFDGVDDYVDTNSTKFSGASEFSISMWANFSSLSGNNPIVSNWFSGVTNYIVRYSSTKLQFYLSTTGGVAKVTEYTFTPTLGIWYNIICVYNGSNISIYINGNQQGTPTAITGTVLANTNNCLIGERGTEHFSGIIDEVSYFDKALTPTEITSISAAPTDLTDLSPVAWYRMGDNGSWKSPQWLLPNNENKDKVSNYSLSFDGIDNYVDCGNSAALKPNIITVSCWIRGSANSAFTRIISQDGPTGGADAYGFYVTTATNKIVFAIKTNVTGTVTSATSGVVLDNNWHHLVGTYDGSEVILYVDGVAVGSPSSGTSILSYGSGNLTIGCFSEPTTLPDYLFNGNIDEVSIFDSVIPIGDLWDGSGQPTDLTDLSPIAWYRMGEEANFTSNWLVDNSALDNYSKRSFDFDGVDNKIEIGTQSLGITGAISVSAWVKIPTSNTGGGGTNTQTFVCEDRTSGTNRNWVLNWRGGGLNQISGVIWDSGGTAIAATTTAIVPNDGNWHHVMFTYTGDTSTDGLKLFVDGIRRAQATSANGGTRSTTAVVPTIGGLSQTLANMFEGNIDEVSIFNTDQSANVSTIYNSGIPNDLTELSPLHWYRMGEDASFNGTNWIVPDNVGSNNGTSNAMLVDALVGEAPNYSGGGISSGMTIEDRVGNTPNSENNALSFNMESVDRTTDVPT
jgi:hypothetical protein